MSRVDSEFVTLRSQRQSIKSPTEKAIENAGPFPNCRGLYPDCPEKPDKENPMCRNCPVLEDENSD